MKKYVIIVAGGSGSRMGSYIPKQFLLLKGMPILMHTISAFYNTDSATEIVLVLPEKEITMWENLCKEHSFTVAHKVVKGGETRYHSVKNGLASIQDTQSLVAVHDGVRPFVSSEIINNSFNLASKKGSAIVAVTLKDSIRKITPDGKSMAEDRSMYVLVQTPQVFRTSVLKDAFEKVKYDSTITDDASVIEKAGYEVFLTTGDYKNIKITTPEDLLVAEGFLR